MPFRLSREESQKDLVDIIADFGKGLKKVFKSEKKPISKNPTHGTLTFGVVYANDLAKAEIEKENPNFLVGSIIVREKNASETNETPETVIAMVKREKGFSKKTGDWEFLVFNGADLKMQRTRNKRRLCGLSYSSRKNRLGFS